MAFRVLKPTPDGAGYYYGTMNVRGTSYRIDVTVNYPHRAFINGEPLHEAPGFDTVEMAEEAAIRAVNRRRRRWYPFCKH